jgi:asparagine synthase (glutamine-hydrolysing)
MRCPKAGGAVSGGAHPPGIAVRGAASAVCGIAGILRFDGASAGSGPALTMARSIAHRGPDGEGVYASGCVALSFRRLSIIDLSDNASQPMTNEDGSLWLVFNGEIYNYVELVPALRERGHQFRSHCDSEVILHAYEEDGPECTSRFNGMWAFAIWDSRRRRLVLSRDRLGEKPLYYILRRDALYFASEIKALLSLRSVGVEVDHKEVAYFIDHGVTDTRPETFFKHILQVPPGHTAVFEADGSHSIRRYWSAPEPGEVEPISPSRAASSFRELLYDSVHIRMRSDVPVGAGLSGGVDSTSIVAVMSKFLNGSPVRTFSSILGEPEYNEERYISAVNSAYPTLPHRTTPSSDFMAVLPRLVWHQELPLVGPGVYSQWCVMELARGKVKVMLDGQGADELLGGYFYYFPEYLADFLRVAWWPPSTARLLLALCRVVRKTSPLQAARIFAEALRRVRGHPLPAEFQSGTLGDFLLPEIAATLGDALGPGTARNDGFLASSMHHDTTHSSVPRQLHYQDRNSMAHGIEARVPFLDYRLVEFCLRLPASQRIDLGVTKALLRRAFREELPPIVRKRIDKKGFSEPLGSWLRGKGHGQVSEILLSDRARSRNLLRRDRIEKALVEHLAGIDRTIPIYRALTLEVWFRLFVDGEGFGLFPSGPGAGEVKADSGGQATL